jgi:hypothetical protein
MPRRNKRQIAFLMGTVDNRQSTFDIPDTLRLTPEWCQCGPAQTFLSYPDDGECKCGIWKHHAHCGTCGKVSQIS